MDTLYYKQTLAAITELCRKAKLKAGNIVVVGCSTSEVVGSKIGTNSNPEVAGEIFSALRDYTKAKGIYLAIQCCEHLNRAIITERKAFPSLNRSTLFRSQRQADPWQQKRMPASKILWL